MPQFCAFTGVSNASELFWTSGSAVYVARHWDHRFVYVMRKILVCFFGGFCFLLFEATIAQPDLRHLCCRDVFPSFNRRSTPDRTFRTLEKLETAPNGAKNILKWKRRSRRVDLLRNYSKRSPVAKVMGQTKSGTILKKSKIQINPFIFLCPGGNNVSPRPKRVPH